MTWGSANSIWLSMWMIMNAIHKKHQEMGCICYENPAMGIYFISDPDGYWIEIVPENK